MLSESGSLASHAEADPPQSSRKRVRPNLSTAGCDFNTNRVQQTVERALEIIRAAHLAGVRVRGFVCNGSSVASRRVSLDNSYISCALGCPFEGAIDPAKVSAHAVMRSAHRRSGSISHSLFTVLQNLLHIPQMFLSTSYKEVASLPNESVAREVLRDLDAPFVFLRHVPASVEAAISLRTDGAW
eukprot:6195022-Pleurochrysis_carterae.AAC.1